MKTKVGLAILAVLVMAVTALPAVAQITADAPLIRFDLALQYTWGLFNAFGDIIWPLFGLSMVVFVIGLLWRLKP